MGYTTDFDGQFEFNRKLTKKELQAMETLYETRHEDGYKEKPSIWLQWIVEEYHDTHYLIWDGNEKFYNYIEWLEYLIKYFFKPNNLSITGRVRWRGEEFDDMRTISVEDNEVEVLEFVQPGICRGRGFSYRKWGL